MIDPQALHIAALDQAKNQPMDVLEQLGELHAQPGKLVDIEEATVIDLLCGNPPVGDPVCLSLEQSVQPAKARRVAGLACESFQRDFDRRGDNSFASAFRQPKFELGRALPRIVPAPRIRNGATPVQVPQAFPRPSRELSRKNAAKSESDDRSTTR